MNKGKEQIKRKDNSQEDYLASRVMAVFTAAVLLLFGLTYLWNAFEVGTTFFFAMNMTNILVWVSLAGAAGGIVWLVSDIKKDRLKKAPVFNGAMCTAFFLVLLFSVLMIKYNYSMAKRVVYVVIPAIAILHLIYCSYQREFFWLCVTHSVVFFLTWGAGVTNNGKLAAAAAAFSVCLCLLGVIVFFAAKKNGGTVKIGKAGIRVFDNKNISSTTVCVIYGVTAAAAAAAFFLGGSIMYYVLYGLAGFMLLELGYFTVKLI